MPCIWKCLKLRPGRWDQEKVPSCPSPFVCVRPGSGCALLCLSAFVDVVCGLVLLKTMKSTNRWLFTGLVPLPGCLVQVESAVRRRQIFSRRILFSTNWERFCLLASALRLFA